MCGVTVTVTLTSPPRGMFLCRANDLITIFVGLDLNPNLDVATRMKKGPPRRRPLDLGDSHGPNPWPRWQRRKKDGRRCPYGKGRPRRCPSIWGPLFSGRSPSLRSIAEKAEVEER
ncbi:hypothetical protein Salat_1682000 [Sesamum alatum]|uniref:Uncharacterized protein n=1 Tax=Sesamum alatum TaxID=300844 RepID=A0AAE1Y719_9LAMI|nr:hypothetical protein Salat_1682000 [Sesamum alatum]